MAEKQQGTQRAHVNKHTKKRSQPDLEKRTIRLTLLTQQSGKNNPLSSQCYTGGGKTRASLGNLARPVTLEYAVALYATRLLFWVRKVVIGKEAEISAIPYTLLLPLFTYGMLLLFAQGGSCVLNKQLTKKYRVLCMAA